MYLQDMSLLKQVLQQFGHSPWTEQAVSHAHTVADLEDKFKNYTQIYDTSPNSTKKEAAAIWLLWEATKKKKNLFLQLANCQETLEQKETAFTDYAQIEYLKK